MYKLKNMVRRSAAFTAAVSMLVGVGSTALPAVVHADALNPLTERTLLLSSSSPGWDYLDGSGNTTYAPPGSGSNGQKTGETFSFKTTTNSASSNQLKGFTFQWCTTAAGLCTSPGNMSDQDDVDDGIASDLSVNYDASAVVGTDFKIEYKQPAGSWTNVSSDWEAVASNKENGPGATGENNFVSMTYTGSGSGLATAAITEYRITFVASDDYYITNPGKGAFFVKINTFNNPDTTDTDNIVDGGVTVANVMNQSIRITTKVLETLDFSVGTVNPDMENVAHTQCDPITTSTGNSIKMGDTNAEDSLKTSYAYDANSYWRLSSNSSNGATVYYSGYTLSNTVGDEINPIYDLDSGTNVSGDGSAGYSHKGSEQFGLAMDTTTPSTAYDAAFQTAVNADADDDFLFPHLTPLLAEANYANGGGDIQTNDSGAKFAFDEDSDTTPVALASENADVVTCATAKMRYIANIAATTPAGIYTTKINYLAAPEY